MRREVLGLATTDGVDGRLLDVVGGVEVRFADTQVDGILARGPQFPGTPGQCKDGGRFHTREAFGEVIHDQRGCFRHYAAAAILA